MALALLTGYPGFIGDRLAARLLESDPEASVVALVAASGHGDRLEVLAGDIAERRLGLSEADWDRLTGELRRVYHLAAIYDLAVPLEAAQRVNVDGTANVLELCTASAGLERLAYVSTAYVAGLRTGVVYEHELVMGQDFKNHYESTKFQAEVWVRDSMDRVPTTILRPAIVVGDSRTGETRKFDGPYFILRTIAEAERAGRAVVQFGRADAPFSVVPVDFVVEAIAAAAESDAAVGQTMHLVDPEPLAAAAVRLQAIRERLGGTPPESLVYLNHPVRFDTRRAVDVLEPLGLRPPVFRDYVGPMVRFFRRHEDDPALVPGYRA